VVILIRKKSIISLLLLFSLILTFIGGVGFSHLEDVTDLSGETLHEHACVCICEDCEELLIECICQCEECEELLADCICPCSECLEAPDECICPCEECLEAIDDCICPCPGCLEAPEECICECEECEELLEECICLCNFCLEYLRECICEFCEFCMCVDCREYLNECLCFEIDEIEEFEEVAPQSALIGGLDGLGFAPMAAPLPASSPVYSNVQLFVYRLYEDVLKRTYDPVGLAYWTRQLNNRLQTGASVAELFFFCPEFKEQNVSNSEYLNRLYRAFLNREPEPAGHAYWLRQLNNGMSREQLFESFVVAPEFFERCIIAEIPHGMPTPPVVIANMSRVFVERLYTQVLKKEPDASGVNHWRNRLANGSDTGSSIIYNFVFSSEAIGLNRTDEQFMDMLYEAMFGRVADSAGRAHWVGRLQRGESRYSVYVQFANSSEFAQTCSKFGINRGSPTPPANRMLGSSNVARVWNMIITAHYPGISDRPEHIAGIVGNMQAEAGQALCPFQQQVSNQVGLGLMQWSFGRRTNLENYMWNNGISQAEFITEMNKHGTGVCSNPQHLHSAAFLERVTQIQVNFMIHEFRNTTERVYMNYIDFPTGRAGTAGARAYAELFCALALRPGDGGASNNIQDPGVVNARLTSPFNVGDNLGRISFSNLGGRRTNAENVFRSFLTNAG